MHMVLRFEDVTADLRQRIAELRAWSTPTRLIVNPQGCRDRELEADLLQARLDLIEQHSSNGGSDGPGDVIPAAPVSPPQSPVVRSVL
jgi:hypothetical protein